MALFTFWIYQTVEEQASSVDGSNRHDPDYTMDNFVTTQTDASGKLRYVLAAAKMVHYPDDDTTVLEQPKFTQYATDKPYTKIEGQRANVSPDGEEIEIFDDVVV
ncbi:MAG: LPS export ABC transporter periplasmic protein LptC, partial [Methylophilaceae bacterium]